MMASRTCDLRVEATGASGSQWLVLGVGLIAFGVFGGRRFDVDGRGVHVRRLGGGSVVVCHVCSSGALRAWSAPV